MGENNYGIGWGESREWNGREQERTTVALVGERVDNGMGDNRREQMWHCLGRVENGMGENSRDNKCGNGWEESREWNGMGENIREQQWHWLGRE